MIKGTVEQSVQIVIKMSSVDFVKLKMEYAKIQHDHNIPSVHELFEEIFPDAGDEDEP
jgi:hypothetical protein